MRRPLLLAAAAAGLALVAYQAQGRTLRELTGLEIPELPGLEPAAIVPALEDLVGLGPNAYEVSAMSEDTNIAAFLWMIRTAEGTAGPNGYRTLYGGRLFDHFADHPRVAISSSYGWTSAAGAYQIMARSPIPGGARYTTVDTWGDVQRALALPDFSPASQDAAAVWLIRRRGALEDVRGGRFDAALAKCGREWASLPGSRYGQPVKTLDQVRAAYAAAGGAFA